MAPKPAVLMDGFKEARRDLKAVDRKLDRQLGRELKDVAEDVLLPRAKREAPKGTRPIPESRKPRVRLADSIRVSTQARGITLGSRLPYAAPIHWGWPSRGIDPNPFLVRAAQAGGPRLDEGVAKALDGFMRRHGFK